MTHNEERTHWVKEGAIGLGGDLIFMITDWSNQKHLAKLDFNSLNVLEIGPLRFSKVEVKVLYRGPLLNLMATFPMPLTY